MVVVERECRASIKREGECLGDEIPRTIKYLQGGPKKLHTELMAITLSILNGFLKFFHCWKAK